jgi:hypothetical protein
MSLADSFLYDVSKTVVGAAGGLLITYFVIHRRQQESERQKLMHELAKDFEAINNAKSLTNLGATGFTLSHAYPFNVALTRQVEWSAPQATHQFVAGERIVLLQDAGGPRLSTIVLHQALFWFRRIWRARQVEFFPLLRDEDLYQLWRQALPFVTDSRYTFLQTYFGPADIEAVTEVAKRIVSFACEQGRLPPLEYLARGPDNRLRVDLKFYQLLDASAKECLKRAR